MPLTLRKLIVAAAFALGAAVLLAPGGAEAASSPAARNDHAEVRLLAAGGAARDGTLTLGLEFRMKPGWHVYWRAPGDAGLPPTIDWAGSANLAMPGLRWPLPERFTIFGLTTFVYSDHVVLPITALAPDAGAPVRLRAKVNYLICEKICIPYEAALALDLPAAGAALAPDDAATRIAAFDARVPPRLNPGAAKAALSVTRATLVSERSGLWLEVLARSAEPLRHPDIMVEGPPALRFGPPRIERALDGLSALFRLPAAVIGQGGAVPANPALVITLADAPSGGPMRAVEHAVTADSHAAAEQGIGLGFILAVALLGGLILNLMPCVLPVLSLKLLSVMGHGGSADTRAARHGFLATAMGIVFSFLMLAALALVLKAAGHAVGWGIQFQSPAFLAAMAALLVLFAASLFGLFDIPLPGFAAQAAEYAPGEARADGRRSLIGAFATGMLATLLATPCSAPFLGTALGFALTRGPLEILSVFGALGIGLAAPYLLVAAFPRLATRLPRPGRWMARLRVVLGLALLATAVWLAVVLSAVAGLSAGVAAGIGMLLLLLLVGGRKRRGVLAGRPGLAVLALVLVATITAPMLLAGRGPARGVADKTHWRAFDTVALYNLVAEGHVVFVDVTAEWCVTCKANKALVIDRGEVARRLKAGESGAPGGVVAMRADWTRPNPVITAYLRRFGRFGIPFNVVYGPGAPAGLPLPELLTESAVLAGFEAARGTPKGK